MSGSLSLLVDAVSFADDPELAYLLSFAGVEGLTIEHHVTLVARPNQTSYAAIGQTQPRHVLVAPLGQFKQLAARISARPGCRFPAEVLERAMAFSHVAGSMSVDAVVSPARTEFSAQNQGLLSCKRIVTVEEALAMIGAHVRQRDTVPLGGRPLYVQRCAEVYAMTAKMILTNGQEWWSAYLQSSRSQQSDPMSMGQTVFTRLGQALRGRDAVHEALRTGKERGGILDALHHFDSVLTNGVGTLDALASATHDMFGVSSRSEPAWQRRWRNDLARVAPTVASVVDPDTRLGVILRILTNTRNSIHGEGFDEYLHVSERGAEHRAMMSRELADALAKVGAPLAPLAQYGLYVEEANATPSLNIGMFAECLLSWTVEIVDALQVAMLSSGRMTPGVRASFSQVEGIERQYCRALARVGTYPCAPGTGGLPARSSLYGAIVGIIHQHRSS